MPPRSCNVKDVTTLWGHLSKPLLTVVPVCAKLFNNWQSREVVLKHPGLRKLLKEKTLTRLLADIERLSGTNLALEVYDLQGQPLAGTATLSPTEVMAFLNADSARGPSDNAVRTLTVQGEPAGLVVARHPSQLDAATDLLTYLTDQALEKRMLAQETLERYREINLLYRIQEAVGVRLDLKHVADMILKESIRVIKAESGVLLIIHPDRLAFDVQARQGHTPIQKRCPLMATIAGWVVSSQQAAIVNDTSADPRCGPADTAARSLLCAPLTIGSTDVGALTLYDKVADGMFTASDKKLLAALASSAAIAIETTRETEAQEKRLKAEIRQLRIQIDDIRKKDQVDSIIATDYFARLQRTAQEMRREFEEGL
jgi:hypothetical protein